MDYMVEIAGLNRLDVMINCYKYEQHFSGAGSYEECGFIKIRRWFELSVNFKYNSQVIFDGYYEKGKKVGRWYILFKNVYDFSNMDKCNYQKHKFSGGGSYQEASIKMGKWFELRDDFSNCKQITYIGEYKQGQKVGKWVEKDISKNYIMKEMIYNI